MLKSIISFMKINTPATTPLAHRGNYIDNYNLATKKTGQLMLFAGDQKFEHLNNDFYGAKIHPDDANPEHLFKIASSSRVGVFAAQLGLIATYGKLHPKVPYLVKLNSKTELITKELGDPLSLSLNTVSDVVRCQKASKLKIVGIGFTIYPGSKNEAQMFAEASKAITEAHENGLLAVLWIYPRGQAVLDEKDAHLIAGCAGLGACLGADFVKVNYPKNASQENIKEIIQAAGRTGVVFSGGESADPLTFLKQLEQQIALGARGNATGRNIHQYSTKQGIRMANAIAAVSLKELSAEDAYKIFSGKHKHKEKKNLFTKFSKIKMSH